MMSSFKKKKYFVLNLFFSKYVTIVTQLKILEHNRNKIHNILQMRFRA